jgi:hypothetical protein
MSTGGMVKVTADAPLPGVQNGVAFNAKMTLKPQERNGANYLRVMSFTITK